MGRPATYRRFYCETDSLFFAKNVGLICLFRRLAWRDPKTLHLLPLQGQRSPVTPYFFWPKEEAWDLMKETLEGESSWIPEE